MLQTASGKHWLLADLEGTGMVPHGRLWFEIDPITFVLTLKHEHVTRPWAGRADLDASQNIVLVSSFDFHPGLLTSCPLLCAPVRWLPDVPVRIAKVNIQRELVTREGPLPRVHFLLLNSEGVLTLLNAWSSQILWSQHVPELAFAQSNTTACSGSSMDLATGSADNANANGNDNGNDSPFSVRVETKICRGCAHVSVSLLITDQECRVLEVADLRKSPLYAPMPGNVDCRKSHVFDHGHGWWSDGHGNYRFTANGVFTGCFSEKTTPQFATACIMEGLPGVLVAGHPLKPSAQVEHRTRHKTAGVRPFSRARTLCRFASAKGHVFVLGGDAKGSYEAYDANRNEWFLVGCLPEPSIEGFVCLAI